MRLEPLAPSHHAGLCAVGLDPELWRLGTNRTETPDDMRLYMETAFAWRDAGTAQPFATVLRETGQVVGSTRFANIAVEHRRVEIGWTWVARPWQRTAVNTEAKLLMLRHAFETWGCNRVELKTDALNQQSRRAIARLGAVEEGTLRHHMIVPGGRLRDSVYYSILADEWPTVKQNLEARLAAHAVA